MRPSVRLVAAIALFLAGTSMAQAASRPLDWDGLVSSAGADPQVLASRIRIDELGRINELLLWDELGLKYNIKRGDLKEMEFDLRVTPTAWGERRANRDAWKARRALGAAQSDLDVSKALLDRFETALRWLYQTRQMAYHAALRDVYDDRVRALSRMAGDPRFDPRDLVASQLLRTENEASVVGDQSDIAELETRLHALAGPWTVVALDTHLVGLPEIQRRIDALPGAIDSIFPELATASGKLNLAQGQNDLENAKSSRWLDYLQIGWDWEDTSALSKRNRSSTRWRELTGEIGIVVPLFDGSSQDRARKRAALSDAKGEYLDQRRDLERRLSNLRMEVGSNLRQKAVLDSFSAKVDAGALFADYAQRSGADPLLLLQAKATSIESSWLSEKLRLDILDKYLNLLYITGSFSSHPGENPLVEKPGP